MVEMKEKTLEDQLIDFVQWLKDEGLEIVCVHSVCDPEKEILSTDDILIEIDRFVNS